MDETHNAIVLRGTRESNPLPGHAAHGYRLDEQERCVDGQVSVVRDARKGDFHKD